MGQKMVLIQLLMLIMGFASVACAETVMIETDAEIAAFKITLGFKAGVTAGRPEVLPGRFAQGWLFAANTEQPGLIQIGAVSAKGNKGKGDIVVVRWPAGKSPGGLVLRTAEIRNSFGAVVPAKIWIK